MMSCLENKMLIASREGAHTIRQDVALRDSALMNEGLLLSLMIQFVFELCYFMRRSAIAMIDYVLST